jgi:hypothetical protein
MKESMRYLFIIIILFNAYTAVYCAAETECRLTAIKLKENFARQVRKLPNGLFYPISLEDWKQGHDLSAQNWACHVLGDIPAYSDQETIERAYRKKIDELDPNNFLDQRSTYASHTDLRLLIKNATQILAEARKVLSRMPGLEKEDHGYKYIMPGNVYLAFRDTGTFYGYEGHERELKYKEKFERNGIRYTLSPHKDGDGAVYVTVVRIGMTEDIPLATCLLRHPYILRSFTNLHETTFIINDGSVVIFKRTGKGTRIYIKENKSSPERGISHNVRLLITRDGKETSFLPMERDHAVRITMPDKTELVVRIPIHEHQHHK